MFDGFWEMAWIGMGGELLQVVWQMTLDRWNSPRF